MHFLKETPAPVWILLFTVMFLGVWAMWQPDFIPRLIDGLIGALLLSMRVAPPRPTNTNIQTDTVTTDSVTTDSIDNSTVNTENLNVKEK